MVFTLEVFHSFELICLVFQGLSYQFLEAIFKVLVLANPGLLIVDVPFIYVLFGSNAFSALYLIN